MGVFLLTKKEKIAEALEQLTVSENSNLESCADTSETTEKLVELGKRSVPEEKLK